MFRKGKEYNYFKAFTVFSDYVEEAVDLLIATVKDFDKKDVKENLDKMHEIEHNCDVHKENLEERLDVEFLPPIDSEDISLISDAMDDIVDDIEDVMLAIYMYDISEVREGAEEFAMLLKDFSEELNVMTDRFSNFKKSKSIYEAIKNIEELERDADSLYTKLVYKLHHSDLDVKELLIWTRIYDRFENTADAFETAAKITNRIILKNT